MTRFRGDDKERVDVAHMDRLTADPVWDGMPLAEFQRFGRYIREVADLLGLRDWVIRLRLRPESDPDDDDQAALAVMKVSPESRHATMRLSPFFASESRSLQQMTLIHEVLHIPFETMLGPILGHLPSIIGDAHASTIVELLGTEKERTIDGLAVAISPRMPRL